MSETNEALAAKIEALLQLEKSVSADLLSVHRNRGNGASEWMTEDDRDLRRDFTNACADLREAASRLSVEPAPASQPTCKGCGHPKSAGCASDCAYAHKHDWKYQ